MRKSYLILLYVIISQIAYSQLVGTNAYLQGSRTEVGISSCGSFGTRRSVAFPVPAGYHRSAGLAGTYGLGFVAEAGRNGWTTPGPGVLPNFCGDYFLPGSPLEGFAVQIGPNNYPNSNDGSGICTANTIPGTFTCYTSNSQRSSATWRSTGLIGGALRLTATTFVPDTALFFVTQVLLCNESSTIQRDVYYLRHFDPDNDAIWPGGGYSTTNTVVSHASPTTPALVTALSNLGCFVGLGSTYPNTRVSRGGFFIPTLASDVYNSVPPSFTSTVGLSVFEDDPISICFKFDSIMPGECICFGYAHVLASTDLDRAIALSAQNSSVFHDTFDITDSLKINLCYGDTSSASRVKVLTNCGATTSYTWSWTSDPPGMIVGPTNLDSIQFSPFQSANYTAVGLGLCGYDTFTVIVTVDTTLKNARITPMDTSICKGASTPLTAIGGSIYSWSPGSSLSTTTSATTIATPLASTLYTVTISTPFNCRKILSTNVFVDTIKNNAGVDDSLCPGRSIILGGSPTTTGVGFPTTWTAFPPTALAYLTSDTASNPTVNIPSTAIAGTIGYLVTSSRYGCIAKDSIGIKILAPSPIDFTGLDSIYCINGSIDALTGVPPGGVFSGIGIIGSAFSPSTAGIGGPKKINYTYTFTNGCIGKDSAYTYVDTLPIARFTGLAAKYCVYNSAVTLTGVPSGGIFTGPGITLNQFTPSSAGVGTHNIRYQYTNPISGCTDDTVISVRVNPRPVVDIIGLNPTYCEYESPDTLVGSPSGGVFSGPGMLGAIFRPSIAGVSPSHPIIYTYIDTNTCINFDTAYTSVSSRPTTGIVGLSTNYCIHDAIDTLVGSPAGGTFSGPGMSGNAFNPAVAGVGGPHKIIYYYFNPVTGCNNADTQFLYVHPRPVVNFSGLATQYCLYDSAVTLTGIPAGGVFSGSGIIPTNRFSPTIAGVNPTINIYYTYTDTNGCINYDTNTTRVNARPSISFTGLASQYCLYASSATLTGVPSGGTFSGPGVSGSSFNPGTAGLGTHFIKYTYTDPITGCWNIDSLSTVVNGRPSVDFTGLATKYCEYITNAPLTGIPTGGTFAGTGITGTNFNPSLAGVGGPYLITYDYTSPTTGCSNIDSQYVNVVPRPTVNFTGLSSQYCVYDLPVTLTGTPTGGTFSGTGIIPTNSFSPVTAGVNPSINIYYTYTDTNGCINYDTNTTKVNPRPTISFTGLASQYCVYTSSVTLTGIPAGGTFSGTGISGNSFSPSTAGVGNYFIKYTYTDTITGCWNIDSQNVVVNGRPSVNFTGLTSFYCLNASSITLTGSPTGGIFSGPGISGTNFSPSVAGAGGPYAIIYDYISPTTTCANSDTQYVTVNALPNPSFTGLNNQYCIYSPNTNLVGIPAGGVFSGTGVTGSVFSPATAGIGGPYPIIYSYNDPSTGCNGKDTQYVTVTGRPTITISGLAPKYCINSLPVNITATPTGGWFTGVGLFGNTFNPATAGIGGPYNIVYYVIDSSTGCFSKDSLTTNVYGLPVANFTGLNTSYCVNASPAILTGIPAGGVFSGTGIIGNSFNANIAGVGGPYSIRYSYTDTNGCSDDTIKNTLVNPLPNANAGLDDTICYGSTTSVTATGGSSYIWSPGGGTTSSILVAPLVNTIYTVTVTDINNCSASDNVTIFVKIITSNISKTNVTCYRFKNGTATVSPTNGIAPYTYEWSDSRGQTTQTADSLDVGTYTVTITDGDGCKGTNSITITEPTLLTVALTTTDVLCGGDSTGTVLITASGGTPPYNYSFTKDSIRYYNSNNVTILTKGNYVGSVIDANGCVTSFNFTLDEPTPLSMQYSTNQPRCYGYNDGSAFILATGATAPYTFTMNGNTNSTGWFTNLAAGNYNVSITDYNNCVFNYSITLQQPEPLVVDLNPDTLILELGESGQFFTTYTGAPADSVSFEWVPASGLNCTDCPNPTVSAFNDIVYTVKVYDMSDLSNPNPCMGQAIGYVFVSDGQPIYIPNAFTPNEDGENDKFYVFGKDLKKVNMQIFDRWGETIFETSRQDDGWDGTYKGVKLNAGVYIYNVNVEYLNGKKMTQSGSVTLIK